MKKIMTLVLALSMVASMAATGYATSDIVIDAAGTGKDVPVELTADAATFSVTIPTKLPISVSSTGVITTSDNVVIRNNSHGTVKVSNMTIAALEGWEVVSFDTNMKAEKVGTKKIALNINGDTTTGANAITFTQSNFPSINGDDGTAATEGVDANELLLTYDAKIPAQIEALSNVGAAEVTFTVTWDAL